MMNAIYQKKIPITSSVNLYCLFYGYCTGFLREQTLLDATTGPHSTAQHSMRFLGDMKPK